MLDEFRQILLNTIISLKAINVRCNILFQELQFSIDKYIKKVCKSTINVALLELSVHFILMNYQKFFKVFHELVLLRIVGIYRAKVNYSSI